MPCNLNFNECNSFINFPVPIFNCRCRLIALLNSSTTTVINPPNVLANASFVATAQTVATQGNVVFALSSSTGTGITTDNAGNITLPTGRYLVSTSINGLIPTNGTASFALYQDGSQIAASTVQVTGTSGANYSTSMNNVVVVNSGSSTLSLRNINSVSQTVNNASLIIQKLA